MFNQFDIKKATTITCKERIALLFCKEQTFVDNDNKMTTTYQNYNGKIFILEQRTH